jgi:diketogulonate reductase-like aldo/keto reductase
MMFFQAGGVRVPAMLFGTAWKEAATRQLVELALENGFAGIDTANQRRHYYELGAGEAVAASKRKRSDLFLQSKYTFARSQDQRLPYDPKAGIGEQVRQSLESSLEHFAAGYLDSFLLHGPTNARGLAQADWEAWEAMEELQQEGKTRLIGASNVTLEQLTELYRKSRVKPAFVQNRCFARQGWGRDVRQFCNANGVLYQGFSLLTANARELGHEAIRRAVARTGKTVAQVIFRFAFQLGMISLTGTTDAEHMREDLAIFEEFELTPAEVKAIESANAD